MTQTMFSSARLIIVPAILACVIAAGGGCGSARLRVVEPPPDNPPRVSTLKIIEARHAVDVPDKRRANFLDRFRRAMYEKGAFKPGEEMTIEYRFLVYDEGSRVKRHVIGFGAGEAEILVQAVFKDTTGQPLGRVETTGRVTSGIVGGDFKDAFNRAAEKIAAYAAETYGNRKLRHRR